MIRPLFDEPCRSTTAPLPRHKLNPRIRARAIFQLRQLMVGWCNFGLGFIAAKSEMDSFLLGSALTWLSMPAKRSILFHNVSKRLIQQFYNIGQLTQFAASLQAR